MDNNFFKYQKGLTEFIKEYYPIFSIENLGDWNCYLDFFENKNKKKFMFFRSTWRFDNKILTELKDQIVYYTQIQVNADNAIVGLIQVSDDFHLKTYLVWDEEEGSFFTGFEFIVTDMKQVVDFIDKYNNLIFTKHVQHGMGYGTQRLLQ